MLVKIEDTFGLEEASGLAGTLTTFNATGQELVRLGVTPKVQGVVWTFNREGHPLVGVAAMPQGQGAVVTFSDIGQRLTQLGATADGHGKVSTYSTRLEELVRLGVTPAGQGRVSIFNGGVMWFTGRKHTDEERAEDSSKSRADHQDSESVISSHADWRSGNTGLDLSPMTTVASSGGHSMHATTKAEESGNSSHPDWRSGNTGLDLAPKPATRLLDGYPMRAITKAEAGRVRPHSHMELVLARKGIATEGEDRLRLTSGEDPELVRLGGTRSAGGGISIFNLDGQEMVRLGIRENRSGIWVNSMTGKNACAMDVDEHGNGRVGAWNRTGKGQALIPGGAMDED